MFHRLTSITCRQQELIKLGASASSNVRKYFYLIESRCIRPLDALTVEQNGE